MAKVISFHAADHKVGLTQIATSTAEFIAKCLKEKEILLINSDGEYGLDYFADYESPTDLESLLIGENLDASHIKEKTRFNNNFFILNLSKLLNRSSIGPEYFEELISKLSEVFDLIIIDTGPSLFDGASLGSLFKSDYIFYVLNQREYSLLRAETNLILYERLQIHFDKYIINQFSKSKLLESSYIQERMHINKDDLLIVHESKKGQMAEVEHKSMLSFKPTKRYIREIAKISKGIINYAGLQA